MAKKETKEPYTIRKDLAKEPENLTENGQCSRCGGCCASVLPLGDNDVERLRSFAAQTGFDPCLPAGHDVVYAHCPFLVDNKITGRKDCAAYDVRPDVCRVFICSNSNIENAKAWADAYGETPLPEPVNAWMLFNRTGLRLGGEEIPYDRAPLCRIENDKGESYEFHVGRPASFMLTDGEYVPPSIVIGIYKNGLHVFNGAKRGMEFIPFEDMAEVLSESCRVETIHELPKGDPYAGQ